MRTRISIVAFAAFALASALATAQSIKSIQPTASVQPTSSRQPTPSVPPVQRPLSSERGGAVVAVLCYHHVDSAVRTKYSVTSEQFERQLDALQAAGFSFISPQRLEAFYRDGQDLPLKSVLITFDDGNYDVYLHGYPILRKRGIPFATFVYPNIVNAGHKRSCVTWDELKEMAANGATIGCHSKSHLYLTQPPAKVATKAAYDAWLEAETVKAKAEIEANVGIPVTEYAVPFGAFDSYARDKIQAAGFALAFNVNGVTADSRSDPWNVNRIIVEGNMTENALVAIASAPPLYFSSCQPADLSRIQIPNVTVSFTLDDHDAYDETTVQSKVGAYAGLELKHEIDDDRYVETVDLRRPSIYGVRVSARDKMGRLCRGMWFFFYDTQLPDFLTK
jgi:peptidoglycan/xylan/chitin deacetylase (PgdA/CDA1 family)